MDTTKEQRLFAPVQIGAVSLKHRVVMAPLTRSQSEQPGDIPGELMAQYYARFSLGAGPLFRFLPVHNLMRHAGLARFRIEGEGRPPSPTAQVIGGVRRFSRTSLRNRIPVNREVFREFRVSQGSLRASATLESEAGRQFGMGEMRMSPHPNREGNRERSGKRWGTNRGRCPTYSLIRASSRMS